MRDGKKNYCVLCCVLDITCVHTFFRDIFDAMFMVKHEANEVIIKQGIYCYIEYLHCRSKNYDVILAIA